MLQIGKVNQLQIVKRTDFGLYLDGGRKFGEILLPERYVPRDVNPGDKLKVFIYADSEDRLIATTDRPYAAVGEFAALKVVAVHGAGAFLDWGLPKDLLLPYSEQKQRPKKGDRCLVRIFLDEETNRIVATQKLNRFLDQTAPQYRTGDEVQLVIAHPTPLGQNAIVNNAHWGLIHKTNIYEALKLGERRLGYIKKVRPDGKIDLDLHKPGYEKVDDAAREILDRLQKKDGFLAVGDSSPPDLIYRMFGMSKKTFKKAVGALYKERRIAIEPGGLRLIEKNPHRNRI